MLARVVALLAEGVDRNFTVKVTISQRHVAPFAEGVDRNCFNSASDCWNGTSPSSRRAWIEMG